MVDHSVGRAGDAEPPTMRWPLATPRTYPPIWTAVQHRWHRSATVQNWAFCAVPWLEDCRAVDIRRGAGAGNPPGLGVQTPAKTGMRTAAAAWCRKAARDQIPGDQAGEAKRCPGRGQGHRQSRYVGITSFPDRLGKTPR